MRRWHLLAVIAALLACPPAAAEGPRVVVSVKPLHSLVASVMQGVAVPDLLLPGAASAHSYSMRPSDARLLEQAQIVFWIGEGMETFLAKVLRARAGTIRIVEVGKEGGLALLPNREGGAWDGQGHGH